MSNMPLLKGPHGSPLGTVPVDFIRHGSTQFNDHGGKNDKIRGWLDLPLDDRGRQEAHKIGLKLAGSPQKPTGLFSSHLRRAQETAHIISSIAKIPVVGISDRLAPWNLGALQGQESSKVHPMIHQLVLSPTQPAPGGGESFNQFKSRFLQGLHQVTSFPGRPGVISHHRNERVLASMEKAGWNGSLDLNEFQKHGDAPGDMVTFHIPK